MKIGLFFGSFNPIHIGHLILANHILEYSNINELWFVVTPRSPFKKNESLAEDYERLHLVNLAIEDYPHMRANHVEFNMPQPNYTVHTLAKLREDYPQHEFTLIMGEDNLTHLHKWKNIDFLIKNYDIIVYPRLHKNKKQPKVSLSRVDLVDAPIIEISSTAIRNAIKDRKNVKPLLPPKVFEALDKSNLYA
ncbi:nicotinate-nucleotide adenylyltransferase [Flavobacteriaceae bacterium Ap0902]|nr:nicotinate-nucleotide adenylyltransferase [Flavobacteriaceae bacterium Ap0902]